MRIAIISTALGLFFFACSYLGFRTGLRLGMQTAKGQIPPKIAIPTTRQADTQSELLRGFGNMMAYNGDPPKGER